MFAERGWMVVRGAVDRALVAELLQASEEVFATELARASSSDGVPQVTEPSRRHPVLMRWLAETPFRHAADALGVERVQLLQDSLLVKPPRADTHLAWHQDATFYGFLEPLVAASVRLALTPCTVASGCLWVIDGSHLGGLADAGGFGRARVSDTRPASLTHSHATPVELEPGDISIHHALTFHASFANTTDSARRTLVAHVTSAASLFVPERMPAGVDLSWFPTTASGHLDPWRFPLLPLGDG